MPLQPHLNRFRWEFRQMLFSIFLDEYFVEIIWCNSIITNLIKTSNCIFYFHPICGQSLHQQECIQWILQIGFCINVSGPMFIFKFIDFTRKNFVLCDSVSISCKNLRAKLHKIKVMLSYKPRNEFTFL